MWQNIVRVLFIVMFAFTLAFAVMIGIEEYLRGGLLISILSVLVAAVCIYRIVYYAKGLKCNKEEK